MATTEANTERMEKKLSFKIGNEDAIQWLKKQKDSSIDLLITDPPYESLEKHRKIGTTTRLKNSKSSSNQWFEIFPNSRFEELFKEVYRVLSKNSHFYLFCDQETAFVAKPIGEKAGFKFWKPLIWDKMAIGMGEVA
jgi:site-specific DNA-methyltransferase (adenine-specific)